MVALRNPSMRPALAPAGTSTDCQSVKRIDCPLGSGALAARSFGGAGMSIPRTVVLSASMSTVQACEAGEPFGVIAIFQASRPFTAILPSDMKFSKRVSSECTIVCRSPPPDISCASFGSIARARPGSPIQAIAPTLPISMIPRPPGIDCTSCRASGATKRNSMRASPIALFTVAIDSKLLIFFHCSPPMRSIAVRMIAAASGAIASCIGAEADGRNVGFAAEIPRRIVAVSAVMRPRGAGCMRMIGTPFKWRDGRARMDASSNVRAKRRSNLRGRGLRGRGLRGLGLRGLGLRGLRLRGLRLRGRRRNIILVRWFWFKQRLHFRRKVERGWLNGVVRDRVVGGDDLLSTLRRLAADGKFDAIEVLVLDKDRHHRQLAQLRVHRHLETAREARRLLKPERCLLFAFAGADLPAVERAERTFARCLHFFPAPKRIDILHVVGFARDRRQFLAGHQPGSREFVGGPANGAVESGAEFAEPAERDDGCHLVGLRGAREDRALDVLSGQIDGALHLHRFSLAPCFASADGGDGFLDDQLGVRKRCFGGWCGRWGRLLRARILGLQRRRAREDRRDGDAEWIADGRLVATQVHGDSFGGRWWKRAAYRGHDGRCHAQTRALLGLGADGGWHGCRHGCRHGTGRAYGHGLRGASGHRACLDPLRCRGERSVVAVQERVAGWRGGFIGKNSAAFEARALGGHKVRDRVQQHIAVGERGGLRGKRHSRRGFAEHACAAEILQPAREHLAGACAAAVDEDSQRLGCVRSHALAIDRDFARTGVELERVAATDHRSEAGGFTQKMSGDAHRHRAQSARVSAQIKHDSVAAAQCIDGAIDRL